MATQLPEILEWYTLTALVNEQKAPRAFLKNLLFSDVQEVPTENIVFSVLEGGRETAPFVRKNGEAVLAGGYTEKEITVSPPNIRIKRPLEAADLIFKRHAGDVIFAGSDQTIESAAEREIARQTQRLNDLVANAEEWLVSQAIVGAITYTSNDAHFQVTFPKPAGNTIVLSTFWDQASSTPASDVMTVKQVMHDEVQLAPTDVILGSEAVDAFISNPEIQAILDLIGVQSGRMLLDTHIAESGAIFLGNWMGMRWWGYSANVLHQGSSTPLIRAKYGEFVHAGPAAENVLYYGAHADLDAMDAGLLAARRFSKSWRVPDPSVQQILVASRPLPVPRRPGSYVSVKLVSG